jgi:uncharacterized protein YdaU (DUF1376 family)
MPLEVSRLLDSDLVALSTGDEFKAALILWARSWSQVPAASIPDDDRILARMTGFSLTEWARLREMALKNWIKCDDGRLYHPVVADLAISAHAKRRGQADRANSRWAKAKADKNADADAPASKSDAVASADDAVADAPAMQVKGTVEGTEPPLPPLTEGEPQGEKPSRRKPRKSIPDDFPSQADIAAAQEAARMAGANADMAYQAERFRNWAIGKDAKYADWPATWKNVVSRTIKEAPKTRPVVAAPAKGASDDRWRRPCRRFKASQYWNDDDDGPRPGKPGCKVPAEILAEFGLAPPETDLFTAPTAGKDAA